MRRLDRVDTIKFAVFCARDVLPLFEVEYPNDDRPRKAIEAAELCITANTKANRSAAARAAYAAGYAARAADADDAAALKRYIEYGLTLLAEKGRDA